MLPARDHLLPPDPEAFRAAVHQRGRVLVIAPTRAACETIELAVQTHVPTLLDRRHGTELRQWARDGKAFGIVAGTGTGKTLGIRIIAEEILGEPLRVGVVNREREATAETPGWNVVIVTTGIARRWLAEGLIGGRDTIVVDEIHQTSAELELCLALGKRSRCRFIWLSATVDPSIYREYLRSDAVLETTAFDPALRASVSVIPSRPDEYFTDRVLRRYIGSRRAVAVFLPTRAEVEALGEEIGARYPRLRTAFYHGGESIRVLRPFLEGEVARPYLLAMTAAGQSALNLPGLDTVVIYDARYGNVVERGRNVLHRLYLGSNEILQMAGRVHGRVPDGEVVILSDRRLEFATLRPGPPEFQLGGDAERVALTCAALGVDASDLELPVPLDRAAYQRAMQRLAARGLIEGARLTRYGHEVEALPVERPWAELLLHADASQLPLVAGASGIDSLHRMTRSERDLHGVLVPGSDHLTGYNLLVEAVNRFGSLGEVHGLRRHVFEEEGLAEWAERRGVLVKAIEDAALGMAAAYRALDTPMPDVLPYADQQRRAGFIDLLARIEPFDLVIDEETADGESARISKTSVAGSWGAVAGNLRYFADRFGVPRASIEGTTIPFALLRQYAAPGPKTVVLARHKHRQELAVAQSLSYFGFAIDSPREPLRGQIPADLRASAHAVMARGLIAGDIEHPSQPRLSKAAAEVDEYWRRSGGTLVAARPEAVQSLVLDQIGAVDSWESLSRTPVRIDAAQVVPQAERRRLDALPSSVHLRGDAVPLVYQVRDGKASVQIVLREGQARRMQPREVPPLDRPVTFAVRKKGGVLESASLDELRAMLGRSHDDQPERSHDRPASRRHASGRRGRAPRGRPRR